MIKLSCKECGKKLEAPDGAEGKKARCPECSSIFEVPSENAAGRTCPGCETVYTDCRSVCTSCGINLITGKKVMPDVIKINCGTCGKDFEVSGESADKILKCPGCGTDHKIPDGSVPPCPECGTANTEFVAPHDFFVLCLLGMAFARIWLWLLRDWGSNGGVGDLVLAGLSLFFLLCLVMLPFGLIHWIARKIKKGRQYLCKSCKTKYLVENGEYFEPG